MTEKFNEATRNRPQGERVIDADSVYIDLPAYISQIRNEEAWHKNDRNSITVFKTNEMRIVLGGLHAGAELPPHKADGMMSIQVIEGALEVNTDSLSETLKKGQIIAIHKHNNYRMVATEETIYLLTITNVG